MPFPFEDFDCKKYIEIPDSDIPRDKLSEIVFLSLIEASHKTRDCLNCFLKIKSIEEIENKQYQIIFIAHYTNIHREKAQKRIEIVIG